ncbi:unnamed protein product [Linum tenue]|uniref:Uncharacterized protein n=1 Tax=Linum tenue TaxID=586396 RepID=A0AAV0KHF4_9ROSI|nr:unnamed protein product [Linum tenue]
MMPKSTPFSGSIIFLCSHSWKFSYSTEVAAAIHSQLPLLPLLVGKQSIVAC